MKQTTVRYFLTEDSFNGLNI